MEHTNMANSSLHQQLHQQFGQGLGNNGGGPPGDRQDDKSQRGHYADGIRPTDFMTVMKDAGSSDESSDESRNASADKRRQAFRAYTDKLPRLLRHYHMQLESYASGAYAAGYGTVPEAEHGHQGGYADLRYPSDGGRYPKPAGRGRSQDIRERSPPRDLPHNNYRDRTSRPSYTRDSRGPPSGDTPAERLAKLRQERAVESSPPTSAAQPLATQPPYHQGGSDNQMLQAFERRFQDQERRHEEELRVLRDQIARQQQDLARQQHDHAQLVSQLSSTLQNGILPAAAALQYPGINASQHAHATQQQQQQNALQEQQAQQELLQAQQEQQESQQQQPPAAEESLPTASTSTDVEMTGAANTPLTSAAAQPQPESGAQHEARVPAFTEMMGPVGTNPFEFKSWLPDRSSSRQRLQDGKGEGRKKDYGRDGRLGGAVSACSCWVVSTNTTIGGEKTISILYWCM
ncbi:unnamed protein product [Alternaria sp. RS040]